MKWPICGPKLSLCCTIISVWGIIQFFLLGIFFFVEAAPLLDDFTFETNASNITVFNSDLKTAFHQRAYNCWIAAILYIALLVFSGYQFATHLKTSSSPNISTSAPSPFTGVTTEGNGYNPQHNIQYTGDQNDT